MSKTFWQIAKETMAKKYVHIECKRTNCTYNNLGNCNKGRCIIVKLDENGICESYNL